jgi:hypothetical protein
MAPLLAFIFCAGTQNSSYSFGQNYRGFATKPKTAEKRESVLKGNSKLSLTRAGAAQIDSQTTHSFSFATTVISLLLSRKTVLTFGPDSPGLPAGVNTK